MLTRATTGGVGPTLVDGTDPASARRIAELEREIAQLRDAVESRRRIGVVVGVISERFALTPEDAWSFLVRLSQHTNIKVRDVVRIFHDSQWGELSTEDKASVAQLAPLLRTRRVQGDGGSE